MKLCDFVVSGAIVPGLPVGSKEMAIRAMVSSLQQAGSIKAEDEDNIVAAILKREELGSTGIGRGVAVPHTKHGSTDKLIAAVALAKEGVDFASLDGEPVYIIFLLISPPDRPGDLRNDHFCTFLRQSKTQEDIWELLLDADNNQI